MQLTCDLPPQQVWIKHATLSGHCHCRFHLLEELRGPSIRVRGKVSQDPVVNCSTCGFPKQPLTYFLNRVALEQPRVRAARHRLQTQIAQSGLVEVKANYKRAKASLASVLQSFCGEEVLEARHQPDLAGKTRSLKSRRSWEAARPSGLASHRCYKVLSILSVFTRPPLA